MTDVKQAPSRAGTFGTTDLRKAVTTGSRRCPVARARATGAVPGRRRSSISTAAERAEKGKAAGLRRRAQSTASGRRPPIGVIRSSCWRSRRLRGCLSSCRSATGGCSSRRSRSSAARPTRWRPIWPMRLRSGLDVQLCGDAHLSNFGAFGAPDRRLVFSINDFDETLPGPFEWDVKRLVASFAVAGRDRGFDARQRRSINRAVSQAYREAIREFAAMSNLDVWYSRIDVDEIDAVVAQQGSAKQRKRYEANMAKARSKDSLRALAKLTTQRRRRAADRERSAADRADRGSRDGRRRVRLCGVRAGRDPRLSAYAESRPSAAARALSLRARGAQGRRRRQRRRARVDRAHARPRRQRPAVPAGQGSAGVGARAVRGQEQVQPPRSARRRGPAAHAGGQRHHARLDPHRRPAGREPGLLHPPALGRQGLRAGRSDGPAGDDDLRAACGKALAKAHARSGDAIAIASYLGGGDSFDRALATFAEAYADQNERDYKALQEAVASGRVAAETGL